MCLNVAEPGRNVTEEVFYVGLFFSLAGIPLHDIKSPHPPPPITKNSWSTDYYFFKNPSLAFNKSLRVSYLAKRNYFALSNMLLLIPCHVLDVCLTKGCQPGEV